MVVQDARPGRVGGEGPIKRVMGRREQATDPAPSPGAAARTLTGRPEPVAPADQDGPWTRPRSPGAAMTGGGPVVNASPTGSLSRSGPGGSPGGPQRSIHVSS